MKVIACGGRDYQGAVVVWGELAFLHAQQGIAALMHGGAEGAEALAVQWAREQGVPVYICRDGPARMLQWLPDLIVAFPGARWDLPTQAKAAGVTVLWAGRAA